ncbi:MAG TPA: hypothetical protein VLF14_04315 [Candidatus Binatia bacterium]|nr:hypothetical protein [Candidatus Binatia bacterium]
MLPDGARVSFDVPGGRLLFGDNDLDIWAEHLVWCYRMLGVQDGATIAVQDYGTSPLAFLGSSSLMPHLRRGVVERLHGRVVCLDASPERVALTPAIAEQVMIDVLIVRAEVLAVLLANDERSGGALLARCRSLIVAVDGAPPEVECARKARYLLNVESGLLLGPECPECRHFHLRHGVYRRTGNRVVNLRARSAAEVRLRVVSRSRTGACRLGPKDDCVRIAGFEEGH